MFQLFSTLLDRAFAVVGALLFIQFPLFIQQYTQQLVGRVEELKLQVNVIQQTAALSNKTIEAYIQKFIQSQDQDFVMQGHFIHSMINRWDTLSGALFSLQNCHAIEKPFLFLSTYSHEVAVSTFHHFSFGLVFTSEGVVYAILGMIAGIFIFKCLRKCLKTARNACAISFSKSK